MQRVHGLIRQNDIQTLKSKVKHVKVEVFKEALVSKIDIYEWWKWMLEKNKQQRKMFMKQ